MTALTSDVQYTRHSCDRSDQTSSLSELIYLGSNVPSRPSKCDKRMRCDENLHQVSLARFVKVFIVGALFGVSSSNSFLRSENILSINDFYKKNRFKAAFLTCSVKASSADLVAQFISSAKDSHANEERKESNTKTDDDNHLLTTIKTRRSIDLRRTIIFLLYGGIYQGMAQEYIYNNAYAFFFGDGTDIITAAKKVATEMFVLTPFLCIPAAYLIKGFLGGNSISDSLRQYWDDVIHNNLLFINWIIWIPVNFLTFSLIPQHFRVSFVAFVSFFWTVILSSILAK